MSTVIDPGARGAATPVERAFPPPWVRRAGSHFLNAYAALGLVYLFAPIFVIVLFSFNEPKGRFNLVWQRFTFDNWRHPFAVPELVDAFERSLRVAAIATAAAIVLGGLVALALTKYRFRGSAVVNLLLVLPLTTPEIVLGSSLASLFLTIGVDKSLTTVTIAHVMFCVSFVALTVKARLRGFDWTLEDAAMDLGAGPMRTFTRVTFPLMIPGILAAALLSFALSFDDFVITLFNFREGEPTFPIEIFQIRQRAIPPQIHVLATLVLAVSVALLVASMLFQRTRTRREAS